MAPPDTIWHKESLKLKEIFGTREGFEICPNKFSQRPIISPPCRSLSEKQSDWRRIHTDTHTHTHVSIQTRSPACHIRLSFPLPLTPPSDCCREVSHHPVTDTNQKSVSATTTSLSTLGSPLQASGTLTKLSAPSQSSAISVLPKRIPATLRNPQHLFGTADILYPASQPCTSLTPTSLFV